MKVFIAGGTGTVGRRLTRVLEERGDEVVVGGRAHGIDALTGRGLAAALEDVEVVVDVLNVVTEDAEESARFFQTTSEHLLAAERGSGVRHHVVLSIVGIDRAPANGYYVGKAVQECLVEMDLHARSRLCNKCCTLISHGYEQGRVRSHNVRYGSTLPELVLM